MLGRYTEANDVELVGHPEALRQMANLFDSGNVSLYLQIPKKISAKPYDAFLSVIRIVPQDGPIEIERNTDELIFKGEAAKLGILADNIRWLADQVQQTGEPNHLHIESYQGHGFLAESSIPIVISAELVSQSNE